MKFDSDQSDQPKKIKFISNFLCLLQIKKILTFFFILVWSKEKERNIEKIYIENLR